MPHCGSLPIIVALHTVNGGTRSPNFGLLRAAVGKYSPGHALAKDAQRRTVTAIVHRLSASFSALVGGGDAAAELGVELDVLEAHAAPAALALRRHPVDVADALPARPEARVGLRLESG